VHKFHFPHVFLNSRRSFTLFKGKAYITSVKDAVKCKRVAGATHIFIMQTVVIASAAVGSSSPPSTQNMPFLKL
jgi:hypothetical protein